MGPLVGHFKLKNAELSCNPLVRGSPTPPNLHSYISARGVDKNYLKWWENQLAMHCREHSLIQVDLE